MDLEKLINENRKIKPNSLKSYLIILRKLNDNKEVESLDYLKDQKKIMSFIKEKALTTQRNYISAIMVVLSAYNKKQFDKSLLFYRDYLDLLHKEYAAYIETHKKSEKEETNWVTLKQLSKVYNNIKIDIAGRGIFKQLSLNQKDLMLLQRLIVAGLYTLQPPVRLDYSMDIIIDKSEIKEGTNYLLVQSRNTKYFIFTEFKTAGAYGEKHIKLNKKMNQLINIWLKYNKSGFLLLNSRGTKLSANGLGKMISKVFEPTGKKITINLLRHVFITENVDLEAIEKSTKLADEMMHSKSTQLTYIKK